MYFYLCYAIPLCFNFGNVILIKFRTFIIFIVSTSIRLITNLIHLHYTISIFINKFLLWRKIITRFPIDYIWRIITWVIICIGKTYGKSKVILFIIGITKELVSNFFCFGYPISKNLNHSITPSFVIIVTDTTYFFCFKWFSYIKCLLFFPKLMT